MITLGCNDLLSSRKALFIISKCLTIFTPPDVDPDDPPTNIRQKKKTVKNGVHPEKSPVTKPVVVMTAIT